MPKLESYEDIDVVDDESRARYIKALYLHKYVTVHPRSTGIPLTPKGVEEACMGYLIDANAGGILIEQHHPDDGTRTKTFFPMENFAFIQEMNIDAETILNENEKAPGE